MSYEANITLYDADENVLDSAVVFAGTKAECSREANARRNDMEREYEAKGHEGVNGFVEDPRRIA